MSSLIIIKSFTTSTPTLTVPSVSSQAFPTTFSYLPYLAIFLFADDSLSSNSKVVSLHLVAMNFQSSLHLNKSQVYFQQFAISQIFSFSITRLRSLFYSLLPNFSSFIYVIFLFFKSSYLTLLGRFQFFNQQCIFTFLLFVKQQSLASTAWFPSYLCLITLLQRHVVLYPHTFTFILIHPGRDPKLWDGFSNKSE